MCSSRNVSRNIYFQNSVLHSCISSYQTEAFNRCYDKLFAIKLFDFIFKLLIYHKWDSPITKSKISYSLIDPQPLPCIPACGDEFRALAFHPHPTFTAPLVGSTFKVQLEDCGGAFLRKQSTFLGR